MLKSKIIIIGFVSLCLLNSCSDSKRDKIGVVDLPILYSSFDYQKELAIEFELKEAMIQSTLDSLEKNVNIYEQTLTNSVQLSDFEKNQLFDEYYYNYLQERDLKNNELQALGDELTKLVWTQLNSYIRDFGEENDYDIILGMKGDGSVMYAKETSIVTDQVIQYVNLKYNGE